MRGIAARTERDDRETIIWNHVYYHSSLIVVASRILQFDIAESSPFVQIALK